MPEFIFNGVICCFNACNFDEILPGCKGAGEFLCIQEACCCLANAEKFPIGMIKEEGAIVKCGLPCCTCGLVKPSVLTKGSSAFLCMRAAASFPFAEEVPGPVCACCAIRCLPGPPGFMKPPTEGGSKAPAQEAMAAEVKETEKSAEEGVSSVAA
mmetsp:Transcript_83427/g.147404  ORF Transcript_83427/g.147404 Transcript_83427/m.147404 type:complete len:155 (-) Transcript_83427:122-586(-)